VFFLDWAKSIYKELKNMYQTGIFPKGLEGQCGNESALLFSAESSRRGGFPQNETFRLI
jgi:hypothetical protein